MPQVWALPNTVLCKSVQRAHWSCVSQQTNSSRPYVHFTVYPIFHLRLGLMLAASVQKRCSTNKNICYRQGSASLHHAAALMSALLGPQMLHWTPAYACPPAELTDAVPCAGENTFFGRAAALISGTHNVANLQKIMTRIGGTCLITIGIWCVIELAVQFGAYHHKCKLGAGAPPGFSTFV